MNQSSERIQSANKIRRQVSKLRAETRRMKQDSLQQKANLQANQLAKELKVSQDEGSRLRDRSLLLREKSLEQFIKGFRQKWERFIVNSDPIRMQGNVTSLAHNTQFRSVHKTMLNKMGSAGDVLASRQNRPDMSLKLSSLAAQNAPPDLDDGSFQYSREQFYFSHIEVRPSMEESKRVLTSSYYVPMNKIHEWTFY